MSKSQRSKMVRIEDYARPPAAAEIIGCTVGRVYQMLRDGDFAQKDLLDLGDGKYMISKRECERIANNPAKTGRPRNCLAS